MSKYGNDLKVLAQQFKALGNPHRVELMYRMMTCCTPGTRCSTGEAVRLCVGDVGEGLDIAPSTLSHHLKELHQAGLIQMQRNGKQVECWVDPDTLEQLAGFFQGRI